jgi:transcriptional regulator with XRE-family HTH domain
MITPAQCRAARALLDWSQQQLADASKAGNATIRNFESGKSSPVNATMEVLQRAFEQAGVEFTNGGQPGVRMKAARSTIISQIEFLRAVELYKAIKLPSQSVMVEGKPEQGFMFVSEDRDTIVLWRHERLLGRAQWDEGEVHYDPPITRSNPAHTFDDDLDQWISRAYARGLTK